MMNTTRTILIALGIALLIVVLGPLLFMLMMGMMGTMDGMMGDGDGMMGGWGAWVMGGLVLLVLLGGIALVAIGLRR